AREGRGRFVVESDRGKLELILTNLVSNAVAYSPPGAVVETRIGRSDGEVVVAIANPAPDLEDADLPHLFERFWRKDQARTGGQHVGLGLTLVKSSADLLGLELGVELTPDRRLRFVLPLPLAAE
ncbi:MAG: two-component sensor histidine kinase, partial [Acidobacteria bacterium]|nr:two-component sensor histidine kinase [Acidobacteriota bacterium]